jgi:hypothetical protein
MNVVGLGAIVVVDAERDVPADNCSSPFHTDAGPHHRDIPLAFVEVLGWSPATMFAVALRCRWVYEEGTAIERRSTADCTAYSKRSSSNRTASP